MWGRCQGVRCYAWAHLTKTKQEGLEAHARHAGRAVSGCLLLCMGAPSKAALRLQRCSTGGGQERCYKQSRKAPLMMVGEQAR